MNERIKTDLEDLLKCDEKLTVLVFQYSCVSIESMRTKDAHKII